MCTSLRERVRLERGSGAAEVVAQDDYISNESGFVDKHERAGQPVSRVKIGGPGVAGSQRAETLTLSV